MDFEEFCAAAISIYQLEALENWEHIASAAFEYFEQEGNRVTSVEELAKVNNKNGSKKGDLTVDTLFCFEPAFSSTIHWHSSMQEMNVGPAAYPLLKDWIREVDGKLSFLGFTKFLHGVTLRSSNTRHHQ